MEYKAFKNKMREKLQERMGSKGEVKVIQLNQGTKLLNCSGRRGRKFKSCHSDFFIWEKPKSLYSKGFGFSYLCEKLADQLKISQLNYHN